VLLGVTALAVISLFSMLLYRHGHKTTIEMDLLLKQMRITSRLWTGMGIYRDYLHDLDEYYDKVNRRWESARDSLNVRYGHELGALPQKPALDPDLACLLMDIEENTL
jgi:hypothetical protein